MEQEYKRLIAEQIESYDLKQLKAILAFCKGLERPKDGRQEKDK